MTTATHETLLTASQAHAAGAVTVVLPNPPSAVNAWLVDSIENVHALGAACVTVKVLPAIVIVPVRVVVPVYAATVNVALPDPLPLEPAIMVIHGALLLAVHAQPAPALTVLLPVPPWLLNVWLVGDVEYEQAAPACVTLNVVPAIVSVPLRLVIAVFAATVKLVLPGPDPEAPLVTVIHDALLLAVHAQPAPAVTALELVPPAAVNDWLAGEMV